MIIDKIKQYFDENYLSVHSINIVKMNIKAFNGVRDYLFITLLTMATSSKILCGIL